jgi:hypothetical protein
MDNGLPAVEQNLDIQDFQRQFQFADKAAAILEKSLAALLHPFGKLKITLRGTT